MRVQCFILIALTSIASAIAQNEVDDQERKQGKWSKNYPSGAMRYEGQFENDKPVGKFTYYYEQGSIQTIMQFFQKTDSAFAKHYHINGKMAASGLYVRQVKQGRWLYYNSDQKLISEERIIDGKKDGEAKSYYASGKISEITNWKRGLEHGSSKKYFESGQLRYEAVFIDGNVEGKKTDYYFNGQPKLIARYRDAVRDSLWRYYHADGRTHKDEKYNLGKLVYEKLVNGIVRNYYPNEILKEIYTVENGKKNGEFTEYYDQGEWKIKVDHSKEEMGGPSEEVRYLDGIQESRKGTYKENELDGEITHYKPNGKIERVEYYEMGKLIKKRKR